MKKEKGITLISLIIYIIVLLLAISMLSIISSYFYSNVKVIDLEGRYAAEYNKFNMLFLDDIKSEGIKIISVDTSSKIVKLYNENTQKDIEYSYSQGVVYRNNVAICSNVIEFTPEKIDENIIKIYIKLGENEEYQFEKTINYVRNK